jgi:hypothetical protein
MGSSVWGRRSVGSLGELTGCVGLGVWDGGVSCFGRFGGRNWEGRMGFSFLFFLGVSWAVVGRSVALEIGFGLGGFFFHSTEL